MNPEVSICCLKQGTKYGPEYVNILHSMVRRNAAPALYEFVCFTDNSCGINPDIRTESLPYSAPGWWGKIGLYLPVIPGIHTERLLFLDLDVVITGSLDELLRYQSPFAMAKDWPSGTFPASDPREHHGNSSVVLLQVGIARNIWDGYAAAGCPRQSNDGDQEWINTHFPHSMDLLPERFVQSYKLHKLAGDVTPACSIVMFHGIPKPPDCGGWVKECWR